MNPLAESPCADLETPDCPLCGADSAQPAYAWADSPYAVVRCVACAFYYLTPRPTEAAMRTLYQADTYYAAADVGQGYTDYAAQEQALRLTFGRLLKNMEKRGLIGGRLLEVGCGPGYLLQEAAAYFEERVGTDFSAEAVTRAGLLADRVYRGGVETLRDEAPFDCIISNHVIEHVYAPAAFTAELYARLHPGGTLVVSTPHMGSWWRKLMGSRWPSFKRPEYVLYFDAPRLRDLLARTGFVQITPLPYPHAFPLSLVAAKLGMTVNGRWGRLSLWLPGTTLAFSCRKPR